MRFSPISGIDIKDFNSLLVALRARHDFFYLCDCGVSDHGTKTAYAKDYIDSKIWLIYKKFQKGKILMQSRH